MRRFLIIVMVMTMWVSQLAAIEKSTTVVYINGTKYYVHVVKAGDTLYSLAKAYDVSEKDIIDNNAGLDAATLRIDQTIKIPVMEQQQRPMTKKEKKRFKKHSVKSGETLYSIARKYEISVATIIEDNPDIDPTALSIGYELLIRKSDIGDTPTHAVEREWNDYKETLNTLTPADSALYHIVQPGETIYSLSRRFGMSEEEFTRLNNLSDGLKSGAIVRVARIESDSEHSTPEQVDSLQTAVPDDPTKEIAQPVDFRRLSPYERLQIALMLPVDTGNKVNDNYIDFYKGFLLALEQLKTEHRLNADLTVFNTAHDPQTVRNMLDSDYRLRQADIIIGPVYEEEIREVLEYAETNGTPVVSPLSTMTETRSPVLFQMQAANTHKYDKFADMLDGTREIVLIYAASNNSEFASEIMPLIGSGRHEAYNFTFNRTPFIYRRNADGSNGAQVETNSIVRGQSDKVFVVMADKETDIDRILTTLSSAKSSITDRGHQIGSYVVLGNRKWTRLHNLDSRIFFKNNVVFATPYHAKRSDEKIRIFDGLYIKEFGTLPSMFSYRGYDAAMIFCRAMYDGLDTLASDNTIMPLSTSYKFAYEEGLYVNTCWTREQYGSNFTITTR